MGGKARVGNTTVNISPGKVLINGTSHNIRQGKTMIGGTVHNITFGPAIGTQWTFTSVGNYSFVAPVTGRYRVELHGGGGGGSSGWYVTQSTNWYYGSNGFTWNYYNWQGGGGGGSGEYYDLTLSSGALYPVKVGAGGRGGSCGKADVTQTPYGGGGASTNLVLATSGDSSSFGDYSISGGQAAPSTYEGTSACPGGTGYGTLVGQSRYGYAKFEVYEYSDPVVHVTEYASNNGAGGSGGCTISGNYGTGGTGGNSGGANYGSQGGNGYNGAVIVTFLGY